MPRLDAIEQSFLRDEFCMEPSIYREYVLQLLQLRNENKDIDLLKFYELLDNVVQMISGAYGSGTLSYDEREAVFQSIKDDWKDQQDPNLTSAILTIAGTLVPHPGVVNWMRETYRRINLENPPDPQNSRDFFIV